MELYTKSKSKTNVSLHCIAFNYIALLVTTSTLSTHIMTEKSNFLSMCSTCKSNNTATDPLCSTLSCYSMLDKCEVVADDPVSCMIHVRGSKLLGGGSTGVKNLKQLCSRQGKLLCLANQANLQSFYSKTVYKLGYLVPNNHNQDIQLDVTNGNTKWEDTDHIEMARFVSTTLSKLQGSMLLALLDRKISSVLLCIMSSMMIERKKNWQLRGISRNSL